MTSSERNQLLKQFFNALPDSAIGGVDVSTIYVARAEDNAHDPVAKLRQCIDWSDLPNDTYLFSGLRGAGKTTELNRLVNELNSSGTTAAFYCDASRYLNLNEPQVALPELLMTTLAGLGDAVRQKLGKDQLKDSIWQRTRRLLTSDVELKPTVKLSGQGAELEIEATLTENPDFRKKLRNFANSSTAFFDEANAFAEETARLIRQATGKQKIVLVVDSLERLSAPTGSEAQLFDTLKEIFFNNPAQLQLPEITVIYSAPPYLQAILPGVNGGFSETFTLPNFKVLQKPTAGENCAPEANQDGLDRMVQIVDLRFPRWQEVLAKEVVEFLAWNSGGNVRSFFKLLSTTIRQTGLSELPLPLTQIDDTPVQQALSDASIPLQWLTGPDRTWLRRFMQDGKNPAEHIQDLAVDLPSIIRLFDHSLVLNYQNGSVWYHVPPLVCDHV